MSFLNVLLRVMGFVPSLITAIEGMCANKTGAEKKDAAMIFLERALTTVDAVSQREIVDPAKFREGIGLVIDGMVECLNASAWAKANGTTGTLQ